MAHTITVQRVYQAEPLPHGAVFLVDRLWPRGIKKERLALAGWLKEAGPSNALRQWFDHDPAKWAGFKRRYFGELRKHPAAWEPLIAALRKGPVTLLFTARDTNHNNAVALREFLNKVILLPKGSQAP